MTDAESRGAHHGELMLLKQRVDRAHRAVGAVFNGQHAEFAQAGLHRGHHRVKGLDIQDAAARQQAVAGDLRVRALHALTGDKARLREDRAARGEDFSTRSATLVGRSTSSACRERASSKSVE